MPIEEATWAQFRQDVIELVGGKGHGFKAGEIQNFLQTCIARNQRLLEQTGRCADMEEVSAWLHRYRGTLPTATVIPDQLTLGNLHGCAAVKRQLEQSFLLPLRRSKETGFISLAPSRGVLLHGPSGTGKTTLCLAAAADAGINVIHVLGSNIRSKIVGESEAALAKVFRDACDCRPCVLLIDQLESICGKHEDDDKSSQRLISAFVKEMDNITAREEWGTETVYVLGTTQDLATIDPIVLRPGRIETLIETILPDEPSRKEMIEELLWNIPLRFEDDTDELREFLVTATQDLPRSRNGCTARALSNNQHSGPASFFPAHQTCFAAINEPPSC
eukprot:m.54729 g.54729  ORF g.54729 m.54729 type:complete len:333 (-) comp12889_c0_seq2:133-1131(-)